MNGSEIDSARVFAFFKQNKATAPDDLDLEQAEAYMEFLLEENHTLTVEEANVIFDFLSWDLYGSYSVLDDIVYPFLDSHPEVLFERSSIGSIPLWEYKRELLAAGVWFDFGTKITPVNLQDVSKKGELPLQFWEEILLYIYFWGEKHDESTLEEVGDCLRKQNLFSTVRLSINDDYEIIDALKRLKVPYKEGTDLPG